MLYENEIHQYFYSHAHKLSVTHSPQYGSEMAVTTDYTQVRLQRLHERKKEQVKF